MKSGMRMGKRKFSECVYFRVSDPDRVISSKAEEFKNLFNDVPAPELYRMIFFQGLEEMTRKMDEFAEAKKQREFAERQPSLFGDGE